jgi:Protein of unknown function (DUF3667)
MKFYFEEKHRRKSGQCHNCDNTLTEKDNFCSYCGQENHDLKVPIPHILEEVVEGLSHFDNKFFTTMKSLFQKPGQITKDFLDGKRTRFVPPLRLFFFVSTMFFFLYSCGTNKSEKESKNPVWIAEQVSKMKTENMLRRLDVRSTDSLLSMVAKKTPLEQKQIIYNLYLATMQDTLHTHPITLGRVSRAYIKKIHQELRMPVPDTIIFRGINLNEKVKIKLNGGKEYLVTGDGTTKAIAKVYLDYNDRQIDSVYLATESKPITWYSRIVIKLTRRRNYDLVVASEKDPDFRLITNTKALNYTIFAMIPFVAFLLWLFFKNSRPHYYEHLIFSINLHSLFFIIFGWPMYLYLLFSFSLNNEEYWGYATVFGLWVYFLISAKNVFLQSWTRTTLKAIAFGLCYFILFFLLYVPINMKVVSMFINE